MQKKKHDSYLNNNNLTYVFSRIIYKKLKMAMKHQSVIFEKK